VCVRFDSEQNLSQEEVQREKNIREMLSREKDMLTGEVFSLRQQLQVPYSTGLFK
jgi:myosin-18